MSSQRRIDASRANGKKSQGPVTPEGKGRSASNATRHGLTASPERAAHAVCLTNEDPAEFILLYQALVAEHAPSTTTAQLLVHEMAAARWRLNRALAMETALLDHQMDAMTGELAKTYASTDEATRAALAFRKLSEDSPSLAALHRYENRLSRQCDRCLKRLAELRAAVGGEKAEFPNDPSPTIEHPENHDDQLPTHGRQPNEPPPAAQPSPGPGRGPSLVPLEATPSMAHVHSHAQPDADEPRPGLPPALPRAA